MPVIVLAHPGRALAPHDLWSAWTLEPAVVAALALLALLYTLGSARLVRRTRPGRGPGRWQSAAFWTGWAVLAVALVSPLDAMGGVLFSAHMVQHELLMAVAAPLLVLGRPLVPALWALPPAWRRALGRGARERWIHGLWSVLTRPLVAWALHAVAILAWHAPALYGRTLVSEPVHALQHLCFLGTALLFWWTLIHGRQARARYGAAVFYLFLTAMYTGGFGALLTVASVPWYPGHAATTTAWGLTPLEDQQLAGLIMWVPAGLSYLVAALLLMSAWLGESAERVERRERLALSQGS
jgi:putative membrane protein